MTGPTDTSPPHAPQVLIDAYEDGWVENTGWVEVTPDVPDPATAIRWLEDAFPQEDRPEGESYYADGAQTWMRCVDPAEREAAWVDCEADDKGARHFWVVKVQCPV
jgi:hypothetical protein